MVCVCLCVRVTGYHTLHTTRYSPLFCSRGSSRGREREEGRVTVQCPPYIALQFFLFYFREEEGRGEQ